MATFRREYLKRLNDTEVSAVHFDAATYAYDAVWTGALALEEARMQSGINLSEFTYENETIANAIYSAVLKVSFNGTSVSACVHVCMYKHMANGKGEFWL